MFDVITEQINDDDDDDETSYFVAFSLSCVDISNGTRYDYVSALSIGTKLDDLGRP